MIVHYLLISLVCFVALYYLINLTIYVRLFKIQKYTCLCTHYKDLFLELEYLYIRQTTGRLIAYEDYKNGGTFSERSQVFLYWMSKVSKISYYVSENSGNLYTISKVIGDDKKVILAQMTVNKQKGVIGFFSLNLADFITDQNLYLTGEAFKTFKDAENHIERLLQK